MTSFLATIAARAVGSPAPLQPRRAQRFEGVDTPATDALMPVVHEQVDAARVPATSPGTSPTGRATRPAPTAAPTEAWADSDARTQAPSPASEAERPVPTVESIRRDDVDRARRAGRDAAERAAAAVAEQAHTPAADAATSLTEPPLRPGAVAGEPHPGQATTRRDAVDADQAPPGPLQPPSAVVPEVANAGSPAARQPPEPAEPQVGRAAHGAPPAPAPPRAARSRQQPRPVDLAALLRTEVFAALTERGSVQSDLSPVVATTPSSRPPRPGTAAVRADDVRIERPEQAGSEASGDVHVHIGRVTVTQAAAPATPRPSRTEPRGPRVDHQAYLARRRERG